jgi:hypothetical protein
MLWNRAITAGGAGAHVTIFTSFNQVPSNFPSAACATAEKPKHPAAISRSRQPNVVPPMRVNVLGAAEAVEVGGGMAARLPHAELIGGNPALVELRTEAHARYVQAEVAAQAEPGQPEQVEASYRRALALAAPRGMRPLVAHCHLGLGTLHQRTGNSADAHDHLSTAAALYREMQMGSWLERADTALAR